VKIDGELAEAFVQSVPREQQVELARRGARVECVKNSPTPAEELTQ
jgi:hypothetical protein